MTIEDGFRVFEQDFDLDRLFGELPVAQRAVCELRYRDGLEIDEIARQLGKTRNAVDQALHNAHRKLKELSVER
jgi:RNA polymerase sigma factor (sigma-70 family)